MTRKSSSAAALANQGGNIFLGFMPRGLALGKQRLRKSGSDDRLVICLHIGAIKSPRISVFEVGLTDNLHLTASECNRTGGFSVLSASAITEDSRPASSEGSKRKTAASPTNHSHAFLTTALYSEERRTVNIEPRIQQQAAEKNRKLHS